MKDLALAERHVLRRRAHRDRAAQRRRRGADRQVPAHLLRLPTRPGAAGERLVPGTAASAHASGRGPLLGIGQVLARLQPEFPELTPSKLRFLEEQRLVVAGAHRVGLPQVLARPTSSGSRSCCRCSATTTCRSRSSAPTSRRSTPGATPALPGAASAAVVPRGRARYRREELIEAAGAHAAPCSTTRSPRRCCRPPSSYGDDALAVLAALVALRAVGIEPRHLRGLRRRRRARGRPRRTALIAPSRRYGCRRQGTCRRAARSSSPSSSRRCARRSSAQRARTPRPLIRDTP